MLLFLVYYSGFVPVPEFPREELFNDSIGVELRIAAVALDLTIPEIANRANLHVQTVRRVMKHGRPASVLELLKIARVLSTDPAVIYQRALERAFQKQRGLEKFEHEVGKEIG